MIDVHAVNKKKNAKKVHRFYVHTVNKKNKEST